MKVAIIGANEYQNKLIIKCKENNVETHVFAWSEGAIGKDSADYFYDISITEKELILEKCRDIGIDGVISIGSDLAMLTVNYVAEKLNLVGNTLHCTQISTNKYDMRKSLEVGGVRCPRYIRVKDINNIDIGNMRFPLIVKPTDRSGSRGVTKVETINNINSAVESALNQSFNKEVIIEEYISGKEFSMEFISQNRIHTFLAITEKYTTGAPNFIEKAHIEPGEISESLLAKAIEVAKRGLESLNICNGASHVEIKIDKNDIFIIEIGARMGGDFIGSELVRLSTGIDFTQLVLDVALGKKISINKKYSKYSMVYFIFDEKDIYNYNKNRKLLEKYIVEEEIHNNEVKQNVTDSSNRHGYSIFQFNFLDDLNVVKKILLEDSYD